MATRALRRRRASPSDVPPSAGKAAEASPPSSVADFLATSDGLSFVKALLRIEDPKLRRAIVRLIEEMGRETA